MYVFIEVYMSNILHIHKKEKNLKLRSRPPLVFACSEGARDKPSAEIYQQFNRNTGLDEQAVWQLWIVFTCTC